MKDAIFNAKIFVDFLKEIKFVIKCPNFNFNLRYHRRAVLYPLQNRVKAYWLWVFLTKQDPSTCNAWSAGFDTLWECRVIEFLRIARVNPLIFYRNW